MKLSKLVLTMALTLTAYVAADALFPKVEKAVLKEGPAKLGCEKSKDINSVYCQVYYRHFLFGNQCRKELGMPLYQTNEDYKTRYTTQVPLYPKLNACIDAKLKAFLQNGK